MPKQERKKKKESEQTEEETTASAEVIEKGKKTEEELDALMDEIDDVLEENAEEFIKNYVQKGGQ
jgi:ubiquitin-like protein Pup